MPPQGDVVHLFGLGPGLPALGRKFILSLSMGRDDDATRPPPARQQGDTSDTVSPKEDQLNPRLDPKVTPQTRCLSAAPDTPKPRGRRGFGERLDSAGEDWARRGNDAAWAGAWQLGGV